MQIAKNAAFGLVFLVGIGLVLIGQSYAGDVNDPPLTTSVDTLLFQNFNGPVGPFATNPLPGWTVIDNGVPEWDATSWSLYDPPSAYEPYWNGMLARVIFAPSNGSGIADWLISPTMNCSGESVVGFSYKQSHSNSSSNPDTAFVFGSTNGGATWDHVLFVTDTTIGALNAPDTQVIDISAWAAGQSNVKIAFCLKGFYVLTWYIDEPFVQGNVTDTLLYDSFNGPWGPFGNNPPAGWTIINEVQPDPPNANDWSRWYYSSWPDTVALAYDNANSQTADEWLISPALSFSPSAVCSLSFYNSYWDDTADDTDSAMVLGSIDGGATWSQSVAVYSVVDDRSTNKGQSWRGFDISSWAQNQSNVKIAFHYVKGDPSFIGWWFIDDFTAYETVLLADNVRALSFDSPSGYLLVGTSYNARVSAQNLGTSTQTFDLNLAIKDPGDIEVYNSTETGITLNPLEIAQVTFAAPFVPSSTGNHVFVATIVNPGDEDQTDDTVSVALYAFEHQGSGGPDAFGYKFRDNTVPCGPEFSWIDISATGTRLNPTSHYFMSAALPIGFSFSFYGASHDSMWVNSHGGVHIGARGDWLMANDCPVPDPSTPHAKMILPFWDRLYINYEVGHGVYYQYFDEPDVDYTVIQWQARIDGHLSDSLEFETILYQDGRILFQYNYLAETVVGGRGDSATVGLEYDVLPSGISYLCNDDNPGNRLVEGLAIRWYAAAAATGDLGGHVTQAVTGTPIDGATVEVVGTGYTDATDLNGFYEFCELAPNSYNVRFTHPDYPETTVTGVSIVADQVTTLDVELTAGPQGWAYLPGDANMHVGLWPPQAIGADITYIVNYLRNNPVNVPCLLDGIWLSADVNGSCAVDGSDVIRFVNYLRGVIGLTWCPGYDPMWPTPQDLPPVAPPGWPNCDNPIGTRAVIPTGSVK